MKNRQTKKRTVTATVSEKQYKGQLARGLKDDEILRPGVHRFRRGSFTELHGGEMEPRAGKVGVFIRLDPAILDFFKARAGEPGALPYQTQINQALHEYIASHGDDDAIIQKLIANEKLIAAIAKRVRDLA